MRPTRGLRRSAGWLVVWATVVGIGAPTAAEMPGEEALDHLRGGNARFVQASAARAASSRSWREMSRQLPVAAVLSCADAALPPDAVFDAAPGELLSVRVTGPVADRAVLASLERAVERFQIPLLVVLGHQHCDTAHTGSTAASAASRDTVVLAAMERTVNDVLHVSARLRGRVSASRLTVAVASVDAESGHVVFRRPAGLPLSRTR